MLLGLFFVTTGASMDVSLLLHEWNIVLSLLIGLIAVKIGHHRLCGALLRPQQVRAAVRGIPRGSDRARDTTGVCSARPRSASMQAAMRRGAAGLVTMGRAGRLGRALACMWIERQC